MNLLDERLDQYRSMGWTMTNRLVLSDLKQSLRSVSGPSLSVTTKYAPYAPSSSAPMITCDYTTSAETNLLDDGIGDTPRQANEVR